MMVSGKSIKELNERESKAEEMLQSACVYLEEGNERMAKEVADKNMNEIEAAVLLFLHSKPRIVDIKTPLFQ